MKRILIIRFSSIGDIVLTTPVVRCIKQQMPDAELHFLTKKCFADVLMANPYIDNLFFLQDSLLDTFKQINSSNYDLIIDLHSNLRTFLIKLLANKPYHSFNKLNISKWILVNFKIDLLPKVHIVDRYFKAVEKLGIVNDNKGLDFFVSDSIDAFGKLNINKDNDYIALVISAKHNTKALTVDKIINIINKSNKQVILLGGKEDISKSQKIMAKCRNPKVINAVGIMSIQESALLIKYASLIITPDTGLMHISAALNKQIISVWGSTTPKFGMFPYMPQNPKAFTIIENNNLKCRPCSKIGFKECPKKHFDCINKLKINI